jgi:hypothetical protein
MISHSEMQTIVMAAIPMDGPTILIAYARPTIGRTLLLGKIIKDTAFEAAMRCRYKSLRQSTLSVSHLDHLIDSVAQLVDEAQQRHFTRWPVLGQYIWPNAAPIPTSYEGEISALKSWLTSRLAWIDENLAMWGLQ